ncbi:D-allose transporter subunit [Micromonospora sp. MW-13]|uniref:ABC transporter permease n=1 Tax=Micromonospora sp. MW-13 TaxID=2094022 RepID=UPI000E438985|nr:ABC transporter permease [Micromonospora sp. MW-13]RGC68134.1 D-allose transporter subunit [Micromonospora sp. MW-13]
MTGLELVLASALRLSVPLLFAALGEWIAERAGALNVSLEGMMLAAAFGGYVGAVATGSSALGLLCAAATGLSVALAQSGMSYRLTVDANVVGLTLNVLVLGLTSYLPAPTEPVDVPHLTVPGLSALPVVGGALFDQPWPAYLLLGLAPALWWVGYRTRWGLELRACGDGPRAADASGVDVPRRRRQAVLVCGAFAGLGGGYLAVAEVGLFNPNMTAGRGYLVLAAVIFGGWTLRGTLAGCLLFGAADAMRLALPALGYQFNPQLLLATPYLLALLTMTVLARRGHGPAALGVPFRRGLT